MDIMELGAIGELVGGVAVIGSLVYLALQVRQSNQQAFRQNAIALNDSAQAGRRELTSMFVALSGDPELCHLVRHGLNDFGALAKDEKMRLNVFLSALVLNLSAPWSSEQLDLADRQAADRGIGVLVGFIKSPGGAQWWSEAKHFFLPALVRHVDQVATTESSPPPITELVSWYSPDDSAPRGA